MDVGAYECEEKEKNGSPAEFETSFGQWLSSIGLSEHLPLITTAGVSTFDEFSRLYTVKKVFHTVILRHLSESQQQTLIKHLDQRIQSNFDNNDNSNNNNNNNTENTENRNGNPKGCDVTITNNNCNGNGNNQSGSASCFERQCQLISTFISDALLKCETYRGGLKETMDLNKELKQYGLMTKLNGISKYLSDIERLLSTLSHQIAKQSDICDKFIQNHCDSLYQRIDHVQKQNQSFYEANVNNGLISRSGSININNNDNNNSNYNINGNKSENDKKYSAMRSEIIKVLGELEQLEPKYKKLIENGHKKRNNIQNIMNLIPNNTIDSLFNLSNENNDTICQLTDQLQRERKEQEQQDLEQKQNQNDNQHQSHVDHDNQKQNQRENGNSNSNLNSNRNVNINQSKDEEKEKEKENEKDVGTEIESEPENSKEKEKEKGKDNESKRRDDEQTLTPRMQCLSHDSGGNSQWNDDNCNRIRTRKGNNNGGESISMSTHAHNDVSRDNYNMNNENCETGMNVNSNYSYSSAGDLNGCHSNINMGDERCRNRSRNSYTHSYTDYRLTNYNYPNSNDHDLNVNSNININQIANRMVGNSNVTSNIRPTDDHVFSRNIAINGGNNISSSVNTLSTKSDSYNTSSIASNGSCNSNCNINRININASGYGTSQSRLNNINHCYFDPNVNINGNSPCGGNGGNRGGIEAVQLQESGCCNYNKFNCDKLVQNDDCQRQDMQQNLNIVNVAHSYRHEMGIKNKRLHSMDNCKERSEDSRIKVSVEQENIRVRCHVTPPPRPCNHEYTDYSSNVDYNHSKTSYNDVSNTNVSVTTNLNGNLQLHSNSNCNQCLENGVGNFNRTHGYIFKDESDILSVEEFNIVKNEVTKHGNGDTIGCKIAAQIHGKLLNELKIGRSIDSLLRVIQLYQATGTYQEYRQKIQNEYQAQQQQTQTQRQQHKRKYKQKEKHEGVRPLPLQKDKQIMNKIKGKYTNKDKNVTGNRNGGGAIQRRHSAIIKPNQGINSNITAINTNRRITRSITRANINSSCNSNTNTNINTKLNNKLKLKIKINPKTKAKVTRKGKPKIKWTTEQEKHVSELWDKYNDEKLTFRAICQKVLVKYNKKNFDEPRTIVAIEVRIRKILKEREEDEQDAQDLELEWQPSDGNLNKVTTRSSVKQSLKYTGKNNKHKDKHKHKSRDNSNHKRKNKNKSKSKNKSKNKRSKRSKSNKKNSNCKDENKRSRKDKKRSKKKRNKRSKRERDKKGNVATKDNYDRKSDGEERLKSKWKKNRTRKTQEETENDHKNADAVHLDASDISDNYKSDRSDSSSSDSDNDDSSDSTETNASSTSSDTNDDSIADAGDVYDKRGKRESSCNSKARSEDIGSPRAKRRKLNNGKDAK